MGSLTIICGKKENPEMLIDEFERYLSGTKKMSANTIEAYRRDIDAYTRFLTARGKEPDQATNTDVVAYLMDLKSAGKSRSTVNRKLASLRIFYKFLISTGRMTADPTEEIKAPKIARKDIDYISYEDVLALLETPDNSIKGKRDRALFEVLYATGVRVSEIIEMKLSDVNLRMGFVSCSGTHGRARIVPMGVPAREALQDYIEHSRNIMLKNAEPDDPNGMLFVNYLGEPMTRQGFWKILKQYADKAGIEEKLTPQTLRNSFAMHMVQNGIDIKSLQELMGHEDISATQVYFGETKNRIKDVYDRCHPRAK